MKYDFDTRETTWKNHQQGVPCIKHLVDIIATRTDPLAITFESYRREEKGGTFVGTFLLHAHPSQSIFHENSFLGQVDQRMAQHVHVYESDRRGHSVAIRQGDAGVHRATVYRDFDMAGTDDGLGRQRVRARWSAGRLQPRLIAHDTLPQRQKARLRAGRLRDVKLDRRCLADQHEVNSLIRLLANTVSINATDWQSMLMRLT